MLNSALDHLIVTANSRLAGIAFITELLGIEPQLGGEHPQMGTHNALLRLGDALYLEVIAVNPHAPAPARSRWFGLDNLTSSTPPRLTGWVARTNNIRSAVAKSSLPLGAIENMTRDTWAWQITIPTDGKLPLDGAAPSLIQWSSSEHPAQLLTDSGCTLESLEIRYPQSTLITELLRKIYFTGPVSVQQDSGQPYLVARIRTPTGVRVLGKS